MIYVEIRPKFLYLVNDNGDCKFKSFAIVPARAKMESTITIDMELVSVNGTGTGEIVLMIQTVDKIPLSGTFLFESKKPGYYGQRFTVDTTPDPDCDPTEGNDSFSSSELDSEMEFFVIFSS